MAETPIALGDVPLLTIWAAPFVLTSEARTGGTMFHPLHLAVAEEVQRYLAGDGELIRDRACGGTQHLPLFIGAFKSRETRMCCVDLLVVSSGQVRVIIEIEESGFLPTKICGKFLQSAIATHFIHKSQPQAAIPLSDCLLFVQVLDDSKYFKQGTRKHLQVELIEREISGMLPLKGSRIADYRLIPVRGVEDSQNLQLVGAVVSKYFTQSLA
jgi:hypothetical protein